MTNFISTTIKAAPEVIRAIKDRFATKTEDGDQIDFNKVIPMPIDIVSGIPLCIWRPMMVMPL